MESKKNRRPGTLKTVPMQGDCGGRGGCSVKLRLVLSTLCSAVLEPHLTIAMLMLMLGILTCTRASLKPSFSLSSSLMTVIIDMSDIDMSDDMLCS